MGCGDRRLAVIGVQEDAVGQSLDPLGEAAVAAAHARGLQPETVLVRRSSLEDVFLRLTGRSLIE